MSDQLTSFSEDDEIQSYVTISPRNLMALSYQTSGSAGEIPPDDSFDFTDMQNGAEDGDGIADGVWMDLGYEIATAPATRNEPLPDPVLMVVANGDFHFDEI